MIRTPLVLLVVAGLVLLAPVSPAVPADGRQPGDATEVSNCRVIDEPGRYVLTKDIRGGGSGDQFTYASQTCLVIESDDVVFEGRGHLVDGLGVTDTTGFAVTGGEDGTVSNVTVRNVTVTDWNRGVYVRNGDGAELAGSTLRHNAYGVMIEGASETTLSDSAARDNLIGVYEGAGANETTLSGMTYESNEAGDVVREDPAPDAERSDEEGDSSDGDADEDGAAADDDAADDGAENGGDDA